jgi:hypothetical protein
LRDGSLDRFRSVVEGVTPGWSPRAFDGNAAVPVEDRGFETAFRDAALRHGETYHQIVEELRNASTPVRERELGTAELSSNVPALSFVISVDAYPFARMGRKLLLNNRIAASLDASAFPDRRAAVWVNEALTAMAEALQPAWAASYAHDEYVAKVMLTKGRLEAVGRDFSRFLPGLFATNYFGPRYVDLIGKQRLLSAPAADVRELGEGVLVRILDDPLTWRTTHARRSTRRVLEHIGGRFFYSRWPRLFGSLAPSWPSDIAQR